MFFVPSARGLSSPPLQVGYFALLFIKYHGQMIELRIKQELVRQKLQNLKESGEKAWEELKVGLDKALVDLRDAFKRTGSRLKKKG